jgi:hypothetical protein
VDEQDRELIATALRAAYLYGDTEHARVRSFRNVLLGAALAISVLLLGLGLVGLTWPSAVSLCVIKPASTAASSAVATPALLVCPTGERLQATNGPSGGDVFLVELVGLVGAALAGVRAISGSRQTETYYSLTVAQAMLKAAAGATTAVIGVVFLSAGILPNVGTLQSQAAILTYAVVFGYAQQLLTGIIDQRADAVLQAASSTTPARQTGSAAIPGQAQNRI